MSKTITLIESNEEVITKLLEEGIKTEMVFEKIQRDTVGRSGSRPTWGNVYYNIDGILYDGGVGLHKEYDYDYPNSAYSEKAWSIMGKHILKNTKVRVPDIDVVEQKPGYPETISHRILDNGKEDLIHIKDLLFHKYEREELRTKKDLFFIEDILECIRIQVKDDENYKEIEKAVIQTLLLDSVTNNADRHANNWALIRNKKTNNYELGVYDHSSAFVDMFDERRHFTTKGWVSSYIIMNERTRQIGMGVDGNIIIEYIFKNYKEYFDDFYTNYTNELEPSIQEILKEDLKVDNKRLGNRLRERKSFLRHLYVEKGELEYDD